MTVWDDLNARARGLTTHLLSPLELERLSRAPDLVSLAEELVRRGYSIDESARTSAPALELAARRVIAGRLRTISRWAGRRTETLGVLFEDEDRRSVAALVRGAVQRAPAELRLSGLLPTPALPERALEELASQPTPGAVATLLTAWRHPLGQALLADVSRAEPDLLHIETSINRVFADRALKAARRDGRGGSLFHYVQQAIDIQNAYSALVLCTEPGVKPAEFWVDGGRAVSLTAYLEAVASGGPDAAGRVLATGFGSRLAKVFAKPDTQPAGIERAVLSALILDLRDQARTAPLSPAPLLGYALRLRAEALDIRWLVWGISLGAPSTALARGLVLAP